MAVYLLRNKEYARQLLQQQTVTPQMARFITRASGLKPGMAAFVQREDTKLEQTVGQAFKHRPQTTVEPRTFVTDRSDYISGVIRRAAGRVGPSRVRDIADYALEGDSKRLRPALTLMLAESIGVPREPLEPLLAAIEQFHTASLILDDLPAQDNAMQRRGRPAAHVAYDESGAQLAAVSLLSNGFGVLDDLKQYFPADRASAVTAYFGTILGSRLCVGQDMDLHMTPETITTIDQLTTMYDLKTSTMLEAALVPTLMLHDFPQHVQDLARTYALHAGIVFQLRDDILDATATADRLGKDVDQDAAKVNIVRRFGLSVAEAQLAHHTEAALGACRQLPFDTQLLQGVVHHFATRNR